MFRVDIVTILPEAIEPYLETSILKRAQNKRRVRFVVHDLRKWAKGQHRKVDDAPYGGGPGMVLTLPPFFRALKALKAPSTKHQIPNKSKIQNLKLRKRTRVILTSAKGKPFTQRDAERYAKRYDRIVILCGHYEGVDERVARHLADEEVSIGPYVLTGGELPALIIADAVTRLISGVLGNVESPRDESYASQRRGGLHARPREGMNPSPTLEYPQYTRPADFSPRPDVHWRVPKILLGGDHQKIAEWRAEHRQTDKT
ncbi:MAG: tRNA (guanosine(37)-N1)-methyltransferase TrmD [Candidatus Uhrbacteria bacterium]